MKEMQQNSYSIRSRYGSPGELGNLLRLQKEEILRRWESRARREISSAQGESRLTLRNSLPDFLEEVAGTLGAGKQGATADGDAPAEHGRQRIRETEYHLEEVVQEYRILRQVLFEVLEGDGMLSSGARDIILDTISCGVEAAAREYHHRQSAALETERAQLHYVIEQMPAAVWVVEAATGRLVQRNSRSYDWEAGNGGAVASVNDYSVYRGFFPDGRPYQPDDWPMTRAIRKGERVSNEEIRVPTSSGQSRTYLVSAAPIYGDDGRLTHGVTVAIDVSAQREASHQLKESELRFRTLANAFPAMIAHVDRDERVLFANRAYADWYGQSPEKIVGRRLQEFILPDTYARIRPFLAHAQRGEVAAAELELEFPLGKRYVSATYVPEFSDQGEVVGFFGLVHDVTAFHRTEVKLRDSLSELEQLQELRERFISALTHDLRNPLTAARMAAEMAGRYPENPAARERALGRLQGSLGRIEQMVTDLLDANRIKAGEKISLPMDWCDLGALADQCADELSLTFGDRIQVDKSGELKGRWNCAGLRRMIDNLASNAAKYGAAGSPITIRLSGAEAGVEFVVHNWGNPIPPEEGPRLFEPFHRARTAEESGHKGWGIGLTLVKGIAEAHGGSVRVESSAEAGTSFTVKLPYERENLRTSET